MTLPAHVTGGYCLTGFICSMMFSINIASTWKGIVVCLIGSLIPDIDNPKALIAKPIYPISKYLYSRVGHRTITHSIPIMAMVLVLSSFVEKIFFDQIYLSYIFVVAMFVHVLLDSFTVMGVAMLYPITDKTVWFIENPNWQFRTADLKIEFTFIAVFITLIFLQGDLWRNGFWTTYNQSFSSPTHLLSEFQKADDVLEVEYSMKVGTEKIEGKGFVIKCDENQVIILEDGKFKVIGDDVELLLKTKPIHTGKQMKFEQSYFYGIGIDSLNQLVENQKLWEIEVEANREFRTKLGESKKLKSTMLTELEFFEIEKVVQLDKFEAVSNPRIPALRMKLKNLKSNYRQEMANYEKAKKAKESAKSKMLNESDLLKRHDLRLKFESLPDPNLPSEIDSKVFEIESTIKELISQNSIDNRNKWLEITEKNESKKIEPLRVSGRINKINLQ